MKRMIRILAILAFILPAAGCAKMSDAYNEDANDAADEYTLIITGCVVDQETSVPLQGITVTLNSVLPSHPDEPTSMNATTSSEGIYVLRKRFNAPAYTFSHTLQFVDGSGTYKSQTMELTLHAESFSLSEHGYYFPDLITALSKQ